MRQEKTVKIICTAILNRINTNTVLSEYRESETYSPTFKEYAFQLNNGVVRVREFAYSEYGYWLCRTMSQFYENTLVTSILQDIISSTIWKMEVELTLKGWTKKALRVQMVDEIDPYWS